MNTSKSIDKVLKEKKEAYQKKLDSFEYSSHEEEVSVLEVGDKLYAMAEAFNLSDEFAAKLQEKIEKELIKEVMKSK